MRKLLTVFFMFFAFFAQAQEKRKGISVSYGRGEGNLFRLVKVDGGSFNDHGKSLRTIGVSYSRETGLKNLYLEPGICYFTYRYKGVFTSYANKTWEEERTVKLISIPIKLRYEIGKYVFFNGGSYIDIDLATEGRGWIKEFTGIGVGIGAGLQYYLKNKIGVYLNPQIDVRNLVAFSNETPQRIFNTNLLVGLAYRIN
jgi:hypothetical protein